MKLARNLTASRLKGVSRIALGSFIILVALASALAIPAHAFQVQEPTYYLNRTVTLTGRSLSAQLSSQQETSMTILRGYSAFFYSSPLSEAQISPAQWTVTVYAQADLGGNAPASLTVEISIYSMDGTTQNALLGTSTGNSVPTTATRIVVSIQGVTATVKNGDRLTVRFYAESIAQTAASLNIFYDGQGNELAGDESRIQTSATVEAAWRQDFEANPFSLSSVNRYWQAPLGGVTQDSSQYYTGTHSLRVSDRTGGGAYARYDFNTQNNPSPGLPSGTVLSFYWLATSDSKGTGVLSLHLLIGDQGRFYEHYWYWSSSNTTRPQPLYPGTAKTAGMYMGPITLGSWTRHELLNWRKEAELTLGLTLQNPQVVSVSLQSMGSGKPTDVYWDNLFVSSYTPNAQPGRIQEGQTTTLSLTVTGALPSTDYQFDFSVTDPAGTVSTSTVSETTSSSETIFTVTRLYPDDFQDAGALTGQYNVTIRQGGPVYLVPLGSGFVPDYVTTSTSFTVHLGDKPSYQRTEMVRVQATGYNALEQANLTFTGPDSSSRYMVPVQADSTGMIVMTWATPRDATIGSYTFTVKGSTTIKTIPDTDQFNITRAVLQMPRLSTDATDYQRTQNVTVHATLVYPDQSMVPDGYLDFRVRQPDGYVFLTSTAMPDGSGGYRASFKIPSDAPTGSWQIVVSSWQSGDAYGNSGPPQIGIGSFNVGPAILQVQSTVSIDDSQNGRILQIQASITYPDGSRATSGQAIAQLEHNGVTIVNVPLTFDTGKAVWIGYYQIKSTDPEGLWLIVISAQDLAGPVSNSIDNVVHNVLVDGASSYWNIDMSLVMGILAPVGALIAFVSWRLIPRRKCLSVTLETEKVMQTVNKVQSTDFFRSIKDQLTTASSLRNEK